MAGRPCSAWFSGRTGLADDGAAPGPSPGRDVGASSGRPRWGGGLGCRAQAVRQARSVRCFPTSRPAAGACSAACPYWSADRLAAKAPESATPDTATPGAATSACSTATATGSAARADTGELGRTGARCSHCWAPQRRAPERRAPERGESEWGESEWGESERRRADPGCSTAAPGSAAGPAETSFAR